MAEHEASRTLVKSAPELWAQCSDPGLLARHLESFGEIRITRLEPETAVAWEGDDVSGTVTLEPAGWGTRVILTATAGNEDDQAAVAEMSAAGVQPRLGAVAAVADEPAVAVDEPAVAVDEPAAVADEPSVAVVKPAVAVDEPGRADEEPEGADEPDGLEEPAQRKPGLFARMIARLRGAPRVPAAVDLAPEPDLQPEPIAEPKAADLEPTSEPGAAEPEPAPAPGPALAPPASALVDALDSLGMAHHRPYSRG